MVSVKNLPPLLHTLLSTTAAEQARQHQVVQRVRAVDGASLCQTLVFGYVANPDASFSVLCQEAALCQVHVTRQAMAQRRSGVRGERVTAWLQDLLQHAVQQAVTQTVTQERSVLPLLARFPGIWVEDATVLTLPDALAETWPGGGGRAGASRAALKLSVRLDLVTGQQQGPLLASGRTHDRTLAHEHAPLPVGSVYVADLGYFSLPRFQDLARQGVDILSRLKAGVCIVDTAGRSWSATAFLEQHGAPVVDVPIRLGRTARFPCRLLAIRAPRRVLRERRCRIRHEAQREGRTPSSAALDQAVWTVLITTLPPEQLSLAEAVALLHARWQIELLWKGWKSQGGLRTSRSTQPTHIQAEIYAKLLGLVVQQWLLLAIGYQPVVHSWLLATTALRAGIRVLAVAVWTGRGITTAIRLMRQSLPPSARIPPRRTKPSTRQRLLQREVTCLT